MGSKLFFSLDKIKPQKSFDGGSITSVTGDEVPGFVNISFSVLKLNKRGSLEPIWHPNAHKLGYTIQGDALVSVRTGDGIDEFTIHQGDMFFIPQGAVHHIENTGDKEVIINFAFNAIKPEVMQLSKAIYSLTGSVFTATFNTPAQFLDGLTKNKKKDDLIKTLPPLKGPTNYNSTKYKFNIAGSKKTIQTKGGYLQLGVKASLPSLEGLGILGFGLTPKGIVEPHWHTNAGELVYIVKGKTRITVLAPDGTVEVMEVNGGQGAFAPASHFHNIENVGTDNVEVIAYFTSAEPDYIGIGEVFGSYSNEVLGSVFNVEPSYFDAFKKPTDPLVIGPL